MAGGVFVCRKTPIFTKKKEYGTSMLLISHGQIQGNRTVIKTVVQY